MKNIKNKTIMSKIFKIIDGNIGKSLRNTKDEHKYSKIYNFEHHLKSMLALQLSGSSSLRDFDIKYKNSLKIKDFNIPSYSQLSRLNSKIDCTIFKDLYVSLLRWSGKKLNKKIVFEGYKDIKIIDSSLVLLNYKLAPELYFETNKAAIRLSTEISATTGLPVRCEVVPGKTGERMCIKGFTEDSDSVYLFDKGYYKYSWYDEMSDGGVHFVTRLMSNSKIEIIDTFGSVAEGVFDYTIKLWSDCSCNKTKHEYREILYLEEGSSEEFRLVTNIFHLSSLDIISLYKIRWQIECFF